MYNFQALEIPFVPGKRKKEPMVKLGFNLIIGSLMGAWASAVALTGRDYPDWGVWAGVVAYVSLGAYVSYWISYKIFMRRERKYIENQIEESTKMRLSFPDGWNFPYSQALEFLSSGVENQNYYVFDLNGVKWDVVDSFQTEEKLILFLRGSVYV